MKLVELLAKELVEWPELAEYAEQDGDREVRFHGSVQSDFFASVLTDRCPDNASSIGIPHSMRVTREVWEAERSRSVIGQGVTGSDPRHNRDRIREIDKQLTDLAIERAERVAELAAEGFALISPFPAPSEDMTDWRNWKVGDLVECVKEISSTTGISVGSIYTLTGVSSDSIEFYDDEDDCRDRGDTYRFKFHSRPSA
jgi:hypothetical protein